MRTAGGVVSGGLRMLWRFSGNPPRRAAWRLTPVSATVPVRPWSRVHDLLTFSPPPPQARATGCVMPSVPAGIEDGSPTNTETSLV
jgi:hypothetical protein